MEARPAVGVVRLAEDVAANSPDHRPVPLHDRREGRLGGRLPRREEEVE